MSAAAIEANGFVPDDKDPNSPEVSEGMNLGFILGLTIPVGIAVIIILILCKYKQKSLGIKEREYFDPAQIESA